MTSLTHHDYDVAIAGGSFAGLVVASQLSGRVALVDPQPIGAGQTSACGTTLAAIEAIGARHTIQQLHDEIVVHLEPEPASGRSPRALTYQLPYRWCTFDYAALCRFLADRARGRGVEIVQARALGWNGQVLQTTVGPIRARAVVDATGWRATIASSVNPRYVRRDHLSCGLEAELPQPSPRTEGLHFWAGLGTVWPGYAWSFPAGAVSRLGVIAYSQAPAASSGLRGALDQFLDGPAHEYWSPADGSPSATASGEVTGGTAALGAGIGPTAGRHLHGGFLPAAPRRPVVGDVCTVGDSAGMCFGLTGEGIRPALAAAISLGDLLQDMIDGHLTPNAVRERYAAHVRLRLPYWLLMRLLQQLMTHLSDSGLTRYSLAAAPSPIFRFLMAQYLLPARPRG